MNAPVLRLYVLVIVLFAILVGFTSRWTVFDADSLRDNELNRRALLQEQKIRRGAIRTQDGEALARSVPRPGDTWGRRYPTADLFAHAVGYSFTTIGRAGIERSHNDELTGQTDEITGVLDSLLGKDDRGDAVVTTLRTRAQEEAVAALEESGHKGALVALDTKTGGVLAMASVPSY
ncbi:MAG: peptidoglycan glycosyltransferase, partial [Solirubrobacteraceae bacterium]